MRSPLAIYNAKVLDGSRTKDALQNEVIIAFEKLYQNFTHPKRKWFLKHRPT